MLSLANTRLQSEQAHLLRDEAGSMTDPHTLERRPPEACCNSGCEGLCAMCACLGLSAGRLPIDSSPSRLSALLESEVDAAAVRVGRGLRRGELDPEGLASELSLRSREIELGIPTPRE